LYLGRGVEGILLAQLCARGLMAVVGALLTRQDFSLTGDGALARRMVRYGAPLVLSNLSFWLVVYLERYALLRFASLDEVGLFGVATRIATFVTLVSMAIDMAWTPFALSIHREPDAPATYARALTWYLLLAGLAGTVLAVFAHDALVLLTTPGYYPAHVLVAPIVAALVLRGAFNIVAIGALVRERTRDLTAVSLGMTAAHVLLLLVLVPFLGAMGAALATLAARVLGLAALHLRTRALLPVPYEWGRITRMAAVFAAAAVAGSLLAGGPVWASLAAKSLLVLPGMAAALWMVRAVPRGEVAALWARLAARRAAAPAEAP
ncbi:MAG TPA: oligosaccharide flippase family protein, partial [Longimicrobium sp.]|nr:oligosaccharide flippase family protein [Longimicrobium sp.]